MSSSTLQFLVAGALIAAWAWMLGRPILTNLFRRSRRDSVGHFRYQQAVLGRPLDEDPFSRRSVTQTVLQPLRDWRGQPLERRRLQIMLGFSFATFFSFLMAIALRGSAIRLFLIMVVCFAAYLGYAAYVGAAQIRRSQQSEVRRSRRVSVAGDTAQRSDQDVDRIDDGFDGWSAAEVAAFADVGTDTDQNVDFDEDIDHEDGFRIGSRRPTVEIPAEDDLDLVADLDDPFDGSDGFGTGDFEEDFFEPIPELQFAPLNLDASLLQPSSPDRDEEDGRFTDEPVVAAETERIEPIGADETETVGNAADTEPTGHEPQPEFDVDLVAEAPLEADLPADPEADAGPGTLDHEAAPSFTAPPRPRQRPARKKARPIYIESVLDEADDQQRVVND